MEGKILIFFLGFTAAFGHKYKPNWESLDSRPLPKVIKFYACPKKAKIIEFFSGTTMEKLGFSFILESTPFQVSNLNGFGGTGNRRIRYIRMSEIS